MRLEVDAQTCAGHSICAILAPDLFEFDHDDRAVVAHDPVPDHLEADAESAVAACPAQAIRRADG